MGPDARKRKNLKKKLKQKQKKAASAAPTAASTAATVDNNDPSSADMNDVPEKNDDSTVDQQLEPHLEEHVNLNQIAGELEKSDKCSAVELASSFMDESTVAEDSTLKSSQLPPLEKSVDETSTSDHQESSHFPQHISTDTKAPVATADCESLLSATGEIDMTENFIAGENQILPEEFSTVSPTDVLNDDPINISKPLDNSDFGDLEESSQIFLSSPKAELLHHTDDKAHSISSFQKDGIEMETANGDQHNMNDSNLSLKPELRGTSNKTIKVEESTPHTLYNDENPLEVAAIGRRPNAMLFEDPINDLFGDSQNPEDIPWNITSSNTANSTLILPLPETGARSDEPPNTKFATESSLETGTSLTSDLTYADDQTHQLLSMNQESRSLAPASEQEDKMYINAGKLTLDHSKSDTINLVSDNDLFNNLEGDQTLPWEVNNEPDLDSGLPPIDKPSDDKDSLSNISNNNEEQSLPHEETQKFLFLEEADDLLDDDDDSYLESDEESQVDEQHAAQNSSIPLVNSHILPEKATETSIHVPLSTKNYTPNTQSASVQPANRSTSVSSETFATVRNETFPRHADVKPKFVNYSLNSSQSNIGQVDELHKKLDEAKQKTDAYDFPLDLVKPGKLEHAKPVNLQASFQASPDTTKSYPSVANTNKPTQLSSKPFYAELPIPSIKPTRAASVRSTMQYSLDNPLNSSQKNMAVPSDQTKHAHETSRDVSSYQNPYAPNVAATKPLPAKLDKLPLPHIPQKAKLSAPYEQPVNTHSDTFGPSYSNPYSQTGSKTLPHDKLRKTSSYVPSMPQNRGRATSNVSSNSTDSMSAPAKGYLPSPSSQGFQPITDNTNVSTRPHSRYLKAPLENINTSSSTNNGPSIISPTSTGRRTHARSNSSVYAPGNHLHNSKYAPTVQPQFQQNTSQQDSRSSVHQEPQLPPMMFRRRVSTSYAASIDSFSRENVVQNNVALEKRQFPIFHWGHSSKIVSAIPVAQGYIGNSTSRINEIKIASYDSFIQIEESLKEFPGPLVKGKSKSKDIEKWITSYVDVGKMQGKNEYSTLWKVLKLKLQPNLTFKELGDVLYDSATLLPYLSQRFMPSKKAFNAHKLEETSLHRVLALLQIGSSEEALQLALQQQDYAMSLLLGSIIGKEKWTSVIEKYLMEALHNRMDKDNFMANLLSIIFQVFVGDAGKLLDSLRSDLTKQQWALNNWSIILSSVLNNCDNSCKDGVLPAYIVDFFVRFGVFLFEADYKIAGSIAFVIADVPLSDHKILPNSNIVFKELGNKNSFEGSILSEVYEFCYKSNEPSIFSFPCLLEIKASHAAALYESGQSALATKYLDCLHNEIKMMPKKTENITMILRYVEIINSQFSTSVPGWLGKPTLSSVWGQLDKSFNKFIGGDTDVDEPTDKGPEEKVFESFTPSSNLSSRNPSMVDLSQQVCFTPSIKRGVGNNLHKHQRVHQAPLSKSTPFQSSGVESHSMHFTRMDSLPAKQIDVPSKETSTTSLTSHDNSQSCTFDTYAIDQATIARDPSSTYTSAVNQQTMIKRPSIEGTVKSQITSYPNAYSTKQIPTHTNMQNQEGISPESSAMDLVFDKRSQIPSVHAPSVNESSPKICPPTITTRNSYYTPVYADANGQLKSSDKAVLPFSSASQTSTLHNSEKPSGDEATEIDNVVEEIADEIEKEFELIDDSKQTQQYHNMCSVIENIEFENLDSPIENNLENGLVNSQKESVLKETSVERASEMEYAADVEIHAPIASRPLLSEMNKKANSTVDPMSNPYNPVYSSIKNEGATRKRSYLPYSPSNSSTMPSAPSTENISRPNEFSHHDVSTKDSTSAANANLDMYAFGGYKLSENDGIDNEETALPPKTTAEQEGFPGNEEIAFSGLGERPSDSHFAPIAENESEEEEDRVTFETEEPIIRPIENRNFVPFVPPSSTGEPYFDDIVDDSDDDDDDDNNLIESKNVTMLEKERLEDKRHDDKAETKEQPQKEVEKEKKQQSSGGWLGWFKKDPNEKKPIKAKLGNKNNFYYDENLKRWVNKDATAEELQAVKTPPPPPPIVKRKISTTPEVKPRQGSAIGGPALRTAHAVMPTNPLTGKPLDPIRDLSDPTPAHAEKDSSLPIASTPSNVNLAGPKANVLDDIMALSGESGLSQATRRKKKAGRRYVNVMEEL